MIVMEAGASTRQTGVPGTGAVLHYRGLPAPVFLSCVGSNWKETLRSSMKEKPLPSRDLAAVPLSM